MKIELIQKKGKHFTWREVLKDNEKEKDIYDRNNPVSIFLIVSTLCGLDLTQQENCASLLRSL